MDGAGRRLWISGRCAVARDRRARIVGPLATAAVLAVLAAPGSALGAGGTSIAAAPVIRPGVSQTANTTTDAVVQSANAGPQAVGCWITLEYWRLPLVAGDRVQIAGSAIPPMTNLELGVFPPGTTDATIATAQQTLTGFPTASHSLDFTASASGTYVVVGGPNCYNSNGGPFTFDVAVSPPATAPTVAVALTLPALSHIPLHGTLVATVRGGNGPVNDAALILKLYGSWKGATGSAASHLLASSAALRGSAHFAYRLPADVGGARVTLHVVSAPVSGYRAGASAPLTVSVG